LDATAGEFPPAEKDNGEVCKAFMNALPAKLESLEPFHIPVVAYKLDYLPGKKFFDTEGEYFKLDKDEKAKTNRYFERTIAEASRARVFLKELSPSTKLDDQWSQAKLASLTRWCLILYADKGFKILEGDKSFNKSQIPIMEVVLKNYLDAKALNAAVPNLNDDAKGKLLLQTAQTYANIGFVYRNGKDKDNANQNFRKCLKKLNEIPEAVWKRMDPGDRDALRVFQKQLEVEVSKDK